MGTAAAPVRREGHLMPMLEELTPGDESAGSRSQRILRHEFVIPPEYRDFGQAGNEAARVGGARVELIARSGVTRLGTCYQQIPVRLMPPFELDDEPATLLYLINLTAGLLDGDAHLIEVAARAGTRAVVTGQSATRIHPALESHATQQWKVSVADDSCLVVLPGPTIPYKGCRYYQRGRVELGRTGRLIWGDVWLAGRYARGGLSERFQFERIVQDFEVRRLGQLVYRDRFRWDGPWSDEEARWHFGGSLASGSLLLAGPPPGELAAPPAGVRRATFELQGGDTCLRWCGPPAEVTADVVSTALTVAAAWHDGPGAPPWLIGSSDLAPNHWFSTPVS